MIPTTNALPRWRLNVETKTKRTLHSSHRLSFNELMNAKNLVLHSSHFALNWHWLHDCALGEHSSDVIWKLRTSSFKCYVVHSHITYSSENIDIRNWVHLESRFTLSYTSYATNQKLQNTNIMCYPGRSVCRIVHHGININHTKQGNSLWKKTTLKIDINFCLQWKVTYCSEMQDISVIYLSN